MAKVLSKHKKKLKRKGYKNSMIKKKSINQSFRLQGEGRGFVLVLILVLVAILVIVVLASSLLFQVASRRARGCAVTPQDPQDVMR